MDNLPGGALDELLLGDVRLGRAATAVFSLTNRSEGKHFRYGGRLSASCTADAESYWRGSFSMTCAVKVLGLRVAGAPTGL